jgi:AcrR family transcriptional regulator
LRESLRNLLKQKAFDEVLVQDIAAGATINRATFYDHYRDKFALFNALVAADFHDLLEQRQVCPKEWNETSLNALVVAVGDFLESMHRDRVACSNPASSAPLLDAAILLAIREIVLDGLKLSRGGSAAKLAVHASLVSGAIYGGVKESMSQSNWRVRRAQVKAVVRLVLPILGTPLTA